MIKHEEKITSKQNKKLERKKWQASKTGKSSQNTTIIDLTNSMNSPQSEEPIIIQSENPHQLSILQQQEPSILTSSSAGGELLTTSEPIIVSQEQRRVIAYSKLKEKIPYSCILMTLKHIIHLSGVKSLFGSKKNLRNFYKFLRKSLILAGTKSALQLGQMMSQLDSSDACSWISSSPLNLKDSLFAKVVKWVFTNYVMIILKTSFYITEINTSRLHANFYLRESWKSISESVRHRLIKSGTLSHAGPLSIRPLSRRRSLVGINSKIRFLPKRNNDMRPIISLKREA
jgi:hypothetical protein